MKTRATIVLPLILAVSGGLAVAEDPLLDYGSWETANDITGAGADVDSDGDGIPNGIEFVIGGDPSGPDSDSNNLLPTVTVDATNLNFAFRRTNAAASYDPIVEYSSNLGSGSGDWIEAEGGVDGVFIEEEAEFEPGVTLVTVHIPRALATGSRLFAHLRVDITP